PSEKWIGLERPNEPFGACAPSRVTDQLEEPVAKPRRPPAYHPFQSKLWLVDVAGELSAEVPEESPVSPSQTAGSWPVSGSGAVSTASAPDTLATWQARSASRAIRSVMDRRFTAVQPWPRSLPGGPPQSADRNADETADDEGAPRG